MLAVKPEPEDSELKKIEEIFNLNKKLKKKKNDVEVSINLVVLHRRLEPIGALIDYEIDLSRAQINQMVSRYFMSSTYGGSMQATFPSISQKKLAEHGLDDFMYLHMKYHPFAPQKPGRCGLFFSPEDDDPSSWSGKQRAFTRDSKLAMWQYMGQYDVKPADSLTIEEWLDHELPVRNAWANEICSKPWGSGVCARIQARKAVRHRYRDPTKAEVQRVLDSGKWKNTTAEEVLHAFDTGKERLGVWTMKCVDYDRRFQLDLCDKFPNWIPPVKAKKEPKDEDEEVKMDDDEKTQPRRPRKARKKGKEEQLEPKTLESKPSKSKPRKPQQEQKIQFSQKKQKLKVSESPSSKKPSNRGQKRKRADIETDSDSEQNDSDVDMSDPEVQMLHKIHSKGTRTRPICIDE